MNSLIKDKFDSYPSNIRKKLMYLRELIINVSMQNKSIGKLEETLKWGEPSYLTTITKSGTTIRIDWKAKNPNEYSMYFNCKTKLIPMFKELYGNLFKFSGNRAIVFGVEEIIPEKETMHCIELALTYKINKSFML